MMEARKKWGPDPGPTEVVRLPGMLGDSRALRVGTTQGRSGGDLSLRVKDAR